MRLLPYLFVLGLVTAGCGNEDGGGTPTAPSASVPFSTTVLRPGTGTEATTGRNVTVRYTLWLYSTTAVDNKGAQVQTGTFDFVVGTGVVPGFSMGVNGMRAGELRRVVIPPNLGYGSQPQQGIPANSTLLFEIELLSVQ